MFDKIYYENLETKHLQKYAVLAKYSKGRKHQELDDSFRTCFQRDRDRVIHSKAFRRLKHKTQVFFIFEGDHYRTRLTHTLEVVQIARQIARSLGVNEDLVEAISLAHDLGHTPFGHAGEAMLNELLKDIGGFEHNFQSRRVVDKLEDKYPDFTGLNLSYEVLQGLMKHYTHYDHPEGMDESDFVSPSLEAQIVNLADQLAYLNHDLDDGLASGILHMDQLVSDLELWREAHEFNKSKYFNLNTKQYRFLNVRYLINKMISEAGKYSEKKLKDMNIQTLDDVYNSTEQIINLPEELNVKVKKVLQYLFKYFYNDYNVYRMAVKGKRYIKELFDQFVKYPNLMPKDQQEYIKLGENCKRVVADYISQMTDNFAVEEHKRIFDLEKEPFL